MTVILNSFTHSYRQSLQITPTRKYISAKEIIYGNFFFFSIHRHNILQKSVNIVYYIDITLFCQLLCFCHVI